MAIQEDLYASDLDDSASGSGSGDFSGSGSGASGSGSYMPDVEASLDQGTGDIMYDNEVAIRKLAMGKSINMRELGGLVASVQRKINAGVTKQLFVDEMTKAINDYYPTNAAEMIAFMQPTLLRITNLFDHLSSQGEVSNSVGIADIVPVDVSGVKEDESTEVKKVEDEKKDESEKQDNVQDKEDNEVNGSEESTTPLSVSRPSKETNEDDHEPEKDEEDEDNEDNE